MTFVALLVEAGGPLTELARRPVAGRSPVDRLAATARAAGAARVVALGSAAPLVGVEDAVGADLAAAAKALATGPVALLDVTRPGVTAADVAAVVAAGADSSAVTVRALEGGLVAPSDGAALPTDVAAAELVPAAWALSPAAAADLARGLPARPVPVPVAPERLLAADGELGRELLAVVLRQSDRLERLSLLPAAPKALVMDFDGVFTDNRVIVREDAVESVRCDRSDGLGLQRLMKRGLELFVLSKERNPVVGARCRKLRLSCQQGEDNKLPAITAWAAEKGIALADVVYIGNDVNDVEVLTAVGCGVAVADAWPEAAAVAKFLTERPGGNGALRELADLIQRRLDQETA